MSRNLRTPENDHLHIYSLWGVVGIKFFPSFIFFIFFNYAVMLIIVLVLREAVRRRLSHFKKKKEVCRCHSKCSNNNSSRTSVKVMKWEGLSFLFLLKLVAFFFHSLNNMYDLIVDGTHVYGALYHVYSSGRFHAALRNFLYKSRKEKSHLARISNGI